LLLKENVSKQRSINDEKKSSNKSKDFTNRSGSKDKILSKSIIVPSKNFNY
jgi:hypothetical protein